MDAGKIRRRPAAGGTRTYSSSRSLRAACMAVLCGMGMLAVPRPVRLIARY